MAILVRGLRNEVRPTRPPHWHAAGGIQRSASISYASPGAATIRSWCSVNNRTRSGVSEKTSGTSSQTVHVQTAFGRSSSPAPPVVLHRRRPIGNRDGILLKFWSGSGWLDVNLTLECSCSTLISSSREGITRAWPCLKPLTNAFACRSNCNMRFSIRQSYPTDIGGCPGDRCYWNGMLR